MSFWKKQPLLKNYVSELDRFLKKFDQNPEATSISRQAEEAKYQRIHTLRDNPDFENSGQTIWEETENEGK